MAGQTCPNCKKGFLIRAHKGTKSCSNCGFIKHDSPGRASAGNIVWPKDGKKTEAPEAIDFFEMERTRGKTIGKEKGYQSEEFKEYKFGHDLRMRTQRKRDSIQKILKDLRNNKYNKLKTIMIEGEIYDVETGQPISKKEKEKKPTLSGAFEELVKEETG